METAFSFRKSRTLDAFEREKTELIVLIDTISKITSEKCLRARKKMVLQDFQRDGRKTSDADAIVYRDHENSFRGDQSVH